MHRWDVVGKTVEEILRTRFSTIQQLAAAFKQATNIHPEDAVLVMENTEYGVCFYFDLRPELREKH